MATPLDYDGITEATPAERYSVREPASAEASYIALGGAEAPRAIDKLKPGSEAHTKVLQFVKRRIEYSEKEMERFYHRWAVNEQKVQAYVQLPDYEQQLKDMTDAGEPPQPTTFIVPFTWAAVSTLVTFLVATFLSRRPHFSLAANSSEGVTPSKNMEAMLQYNSDHTRMVRRLYQKFMDVCVYGVGAVQVLWCEKYAKRTIRKRYHPGGPLATTRERKLVYQGNEVMNIDPYCFFPDPRVPMSEVNKDGEFAFWRFPESRISLKRQMEEYGFDHIDSIPRARPKDGNSKWSRRAVLTDGNPQPGLDDSRSIDARFDDDFVQVDQGTCWIIPNELGLSDSKEPELWIFALGNKQQVIQAEPLDTDHGMHPIAVSEPTGLGYAFGQPSPVDFTNPIQDVISALVDLHIKNVRSVLNDNLVYDPSAIESQDLKDMGPGRRYRLKRSAAGRDVRSIIQQIPITDVTAQHMRDAETFMRVGMLLLGINENIMGASTPSSRRSAREVGITAEGSVSRQGLMARLISAQGVVDMVEQMVLNIQQNITDDFTLQVLGERGQMESVLITPESLVGDFYYPIHDGTLPLDKIALTQVWRDIMLFVSRDEQLRMNWDIDRMLEFTAQLAGAQNIDMMRRGAAQQEVKFGTEASINEGVDRGKLAPVGRGAMMPQSLQGLLNPPPQE